MDERVTLEFFALPSRQAIKQEAFSLSLVTVQAGKSLNHLPSLPTTLNKSKKLQIIPAKPTLATETQT
jgi:hypothetical protein